MYGPRSAKGKRRPIYLAAEVDTHSDGKQVDDYHQDQKHGDPDGIINILADFPVQHGLTVVVPELDGI
jgi:hypothetical protein